MRLLHINTSDAIGGAAAIALQLHRACLNKGIQSRMMVGVKQGNDPTVSEIDHDSYKSLYTRIVLHMARALQSFDRRFPGAYRLRKAMEFLAEPGRYLDIRRGFEDFHFPGTWRLLNGTKPDLVHCHNLHGGYFDLNALAWLSESVPVILTLHDAWLLSGHCAHSFDCERWRSGCGECPYPDVYPAILHDNTSLNWRRKKEIYRKSKFYVATPSHWLMTRIKDSMLSAAILDAKVIPNGIDVHTFQPGDRNQARRSIGVSPEARVLLSVGNQLRSNPFKDFQTIQEAFKAVADRDPDRKYILLALGEEGPHERIRQNEIRTIPYESNVKKVVEYYQAADLYVHAARADTFPTTVLEALACGIPVIGSAIGGVPEQVIDGKTGTLVPGQNVEAMAEAIERLLSTDDLRRQMGVEGRADATARFDSLKQTEQYLNWYAEIVESEK